MYKLSNYLLVISLFIQTSIFAQEGHIFLNHYQVDESYSDTRIRSIAFDNQSSILLASRKGVAVFNGTSWDRVQNIPANVLCLKADSTAKIIYTGLKDEFGYIFRDTLGQYKYEAIKQFDEDVGEFTQIILNKDKAIFYSSHSIFMVSLSNHSEVKQLEKETNTRYGGILTRKGNLYINVKGIGVCRFNNDELVPLKSGRSFKNREIIFHTTCNKVNELIGTNENKLYFFNGKEFKLFSNKTEVYDFFQENILWNGLDFSEKYFAINTLTGGCVIIDKLYGKIKYNINYMTGLPDDEIYAMALDKNGSLWIAHQHGLSSCDLDLNIRNYSPYPGIYGNINDVMFKNKRTYVASNNGVYILTEITDVREKEYFVKKKVKYGGGYDFKKKKKMITHSLGHKFIPVVGLTDKCKQFYEFKQRLLAISDYGVYEITDSVTHQLVKDIYTNSLWQDKDTSVLYAASLKGVQLLSFEIDTVKEEEKWDKRKLFDNISKAVYSIVQDKDGNLIFGMDGKAWFSEKDSLLAFSKPKEISFPEKINEPIIVKRVNGEILFIQSAGILVYNEKTKLAEYKDKLKYQLRNFRFVESNESTWVLENDEWVSVNPGIKAANKKYWNLFKKIRKLYIDEKQNTWLINGNQQLVKILADTSQKLNYTFRVHIAEVADVMDSLYLLENPKIEYERNALKIKLSAPFRLNPEGTQYRFKVEGLPNFEEWSDWSTNSIVELSYIPAGKYTLVVSAKNILGQLSDEKKLSFIIKKPFWQTETFYYSAGGGILLFILLLVFLSRLRLKRKNRILEQKVRERTVELQEEKDKTEELLLNILPRETAEELKENNKVIPRNYDLATVLFTDFKGFTMIAEKLTPEELVHEIDYCFREFDKIISKYRIEKIKTIGDAYMCAAGLPKVDKKNAVEAIKAALEIRDFMEEHKKECEKEGKPCFEIRIGLHTGKVVAGVVGIKKYAYDIWGDTVNLAARMESSGEPGKVNISGDTFKLVKKDFNCTHRGKIEAKNKGQVDMYFVDGKK